MQRENALSLHVLIAAGTLGLLACHGSTLEDVPVEPISEHKDTVAIRIESDGTGNCNFDANSDDMNVMSLNNNEYREGAMCGACMEVVGPNQKPVVVRVVDRCYGCSPEQFGLSKQVFEKMGAADFQQKTITWRYVTCPVTGPIHYHIKEGSSQYWTAIQMRNHRLPIQKLEWLKNGTWVDVKRESYNYFVEPGGMGPGPIRVRVTASDGQQLEDTLPEILQATTIQGAAQFDAN
jgi:expansin (peptidoglycan-binding protein)